MAGLLFFFNACAVWSHFTNAHIDWQLKKKTNTDEANLTFLIKQCGISSDDGLCYVLPILVLYIPDCNYLTNTKASNVVQQTEMRL